MRRRRVIECSMFHPFALKIHFVRLPMCIYYVGIAISIHIARNSVRLCKSHTQQIVNISFYSFCHCIFRSIVEPLRIAAAPAQVKNVPQLITFLKYTNSFCMVTIIFILATHSRNCRDIFPAATANCIS